jgi:hypothetical protein
MVSIYSVYIVPILTGVFIFAIVTWLIYLFFYWLPKYMGISKMWVHSRLKRKYKKGFNFDDNIIRLCEIAIARKWKYQDMKILTKNNPRADEILYTYFLTKKALKGGIQSDGDRLRKFEGKIAEDIVKGLS